MLLWVFANSPSPGLICVTLGSGYAVGVHMASTWGLYWAVTSVLRDSRSQAQPWTSSQPGLERGLEPRLRGSFEGRRHLGGTVGLSLAPSAGLGTEWSGPVLAQLRWRTPGEMGPE